MRAQLTKLLLVGFIGTGCMRGTSVTVRPDRSYTTSEFASREAASAVVDSIVRAKMQERRVVGAAVAVVQNGRVLKDTGYGVANIATGELVTPETAFFTASIAKVFSTAAAIALVEEGRVSLDEPVGEILQQLPVPWRDVTLRQLLANTSGLPDVETAPGAYYPTFDAAVHQFRNQPLDRPHGEQYRYVQTNWALIGKVIAMKAGESFEDYVAERVFKPAALRSAVFGGYEVVRPGRADWYSTAVVSSSGSLQFGGPPKLLRTHYPKYLYPAAGLFVSAGELASWVDMFARGQIISPLSVETVWTRVPLSQGRTSDWGLGAWAVRSNDGRTIVSASGGARASVVHVREAQLTIALVTNTQGAGERAWIEEIVRVYLASNPS